MALGHTNTNYLICQETNEQDCLQTIDQPIPHDFIVILQRIILPHQAVERVVLMGRNTTPVCFAFLWCSFAPLTAAFVFSCWCFGLAAQTAFRPPLRCRIALP